MLTALQNIVAVISEIFKGNYKSKELLNLEEEKLKSEIKYQKNKAELEDSFRGRGVTKAGAEPHFQTLKNHSEKERQHIEFDLQQAIIRDSHMKNRLLIATVVLLILGAGFSVFFWYQANILTTKCLKEISYSEGAYYLFRTSEVKEFKTQNEALEYCTNVPEQKDSHLN